MQFYIFIYSGYWIVSTVLRGLIFSLKCHVNVSPVLNSYGSRIFKFKMILTLHETSGSFMRLTAAKIRLCTSLFSRNSGHVNWGSQVRWSKWPGLQPPRPNQSIGQIAVFEDDAAMNHRRRLCFSDFPRSWSSHPNQHFSSALSMRPIFFFLRKRVVESLTETIANWAECFCQVFLKSRLWVYYATEKHLPELFTLI